MTRSWRPSGARSAVRRGAAAVTSLALGAVACGLATLVAPTAARADVVAPVGSDSVTMVQANIYTGLTVDRFQADVRTVLSQQPDFITYNEVMFRKDPVLAPDGYDIYRSMTNRFTAETPVAWRADRWTAVDHGTTMISDWRGKPPGRVVEIGRRFANWVTLRGIDGRVLSVVTAHTAPVDPNMPDLIRPSVRRLGGLVDRLAASGPVLVGGDFNVAYRSQRYPRDILDAHGLVPTYDALGSSFPTGDHEGATIDYIFKRDDRGALAASSHRPVELNSDHDAVVADFTWQTDAPVDTRVISNDPAGGADQQRVVLRTVAGAIRAAGPGATIEVATRSLDSMGIVRPLKGALARGVNVQVVTTGTRPTLREERLGRALQLAASPESWLARCAGACLDAWTGNRLPPSLVLVSDPTSTLVSRADVSRRLTSGLVERPTRLTLSTGPNALAEGAGLFAAVADLRPADPLP